MGETRRKKPLLERFFETSYLLIIACALFGGPVVVGAVQPFEWKAALVRVAILWLTLTALFFLNLFAARAWFRRQEKSKTKESPPRGPSDNQV